MINRPIVNILTRTSNRPNHFKKCIESINNQTYKNINHIISVDNDYTEDYVKQYTNNYIRVEKYNGNIAPLDPIYHIRRPAPYNLYLNELKNKVETGWIMFLDDDDMFLNENALYEIISQIDSNEEMVFWKVKFSNNRIVPNEINFTKEITPKLNDFDMNGFMFHSKYKNHYNFDYYSAGDYFCAKTLEQFIPKKRLISEIYIGMQLNNNIGGRGLQKDLNN